MTSNQITALVKRIKQNLANKNIHVETITIREYIKANFENYDSVNEKSVIEYFSGNSIIKTEQPMNSTLAISQPEAPIAPISTPDPQTVSMVSFKAQSMGICLAEEQVNTIADKVDVIANDFNETLANIENALLQYIESYEYAEYQAVNKMYSRVNDRLLTKQSNINSSFESGANEIVRVMEETQTQRKSATDRITARLAKLATV
jgi:hypothetical protein